MNLNKKVFQIFKKNLNFNDYTIDPLIIGKDNLSNLNIYWNNTIKGILLKDLDYKNIDNFLKENEDIPFDIKDVYNIKAESFNELNIFYNYNNKNNSKYFTLGKNIQIKRHFFFNFNNNFIIYNIMNINTKISLNNATTYYANLEVGNYKENFKLIGIDRENENLNLFDRLNKLI